MTVETQEKTGGATDPWAGAARFPIEQVTEFVSNALHTVGMDPGESRLVAERLVLPDLRGVDSHGVARLRAYTQRIRQGLIDLNAELTTVRESPVTLALDANNGFGLCVAPRAMERCIAKAEATGICLTTVRRSNHFGIAGAYAMMAAERGLGGMAMTNGSPLVVPTFGSQAKMGTNPLAFAVPTGDGRPLVLDMSTSAVAWGKIEIARRAGLPIPLGWATDEAGQPTTDPTAARWLTPLGGDRSTSGHKGYGLGVMVDVLCGLLAGSAWSSRISGTRGPEEPAKIGHAFLAWRIDAFRDPEEFNADIQAMLAELRAIPPAPGHEGTGVLIPGDPEAMAEATNRQYGIPIKRPVLDDLRALAVELEIPWKLEQAMG